MPAVLLYGMLLVHSGSFNSQIAAFNRPRVYSRHATIVAVGDGQLGASECGLQIQICLRHSIELFIGWTNFVSTVVILALITCEFLVISVQRHESNVSKVEMIRTRLCWHPLPFSNISNSDDVLQGWSLYSWLQGDSTSYAIYVV